MRSFFKGSFFAFVAVYGVFASQMSVVWGLTPKTTDVIEVHIEPMDIWPPKTITKLTAMSGAAEGSIQLQWVAPISDDGIAGPKSDAVAGYTIRYATFSVQSLGGDATAWFNMATNNFNLIGGMNPGEQETPAIGGLEPGVTLYFMVRSTDVLKNGISGGNISFLSNSSSAQVKDIPPTAPINLISSLVSESTISIQWNPPSPNPGDLDYYKIYMSSQTPAVWFATVTQSVSLSSYAFYNLTQGVTYQLQVSVVDKGFPTWPGNAYESPVSNTISVARKVTAPSTFTWVSVTTEAITWQWRDNSQVETGFLIYSTTGGVVGSVGPSAGSGGTVQWTESNLTPSAQYQRYVIAVRNGEQSDQSNTSTKYTLPNAPTNLVMSTANATTITLAWNANNNASGAAYIVEKSTYPWDGFINVFNTIGNTTLTTLLSTGLAEYTTYTYQIRARNAEGVDSSTVALTVNTLAVKPGKVNLISVTPGQVEGTANLQWIAPGNDGTSRNIVGGQYDVRWAISGINNETDWNNVPASSTYRMTLSTNVVAGTQEGILLTGLNQLGVSTLWFAVKLRDQIPGNFSDVSNSISGIVQVDVTSPGVVNNLTAVLLSSTSARLNWTAPGDDGYVNINTFGAYDVRYSTLPFTSQSQFLGARSASDFGTIPAPSTITLGALESMTLNNLALDTSYYFAMRTRDEAFNYSTMSNVAMVFTPDTIPPGTVQSFKAIANEAVGKRVDLSWKNPSDSDLQGIRILISTIAYVALPNATTGVTIVELLSSSGSVIPSTYTQNNLTVGVTYYYSLFAFDEIPNYSNPALASAVPVKTKTPAPSRPKNIRGTRSGDGQSFRITWDSVTTRVDGSQFDPAELSSYTIYRMALLNSGTNQVFAIPATSTPIFTDDTLLGRSLFYKVRAMNFAGTESDDSEIVSSDADGTVFIMMADGVSYLAIPGRMKETMDQQNLTIGGARNSDEEGGKVFKSMSVQVKDRSTGEEKKGYLFSEPIKIAIGYNVDAGGNVTNAAPGMAPSASFERAMPKSADAAKSFSIYWFNGLQWLKLGTTVEPGTTALSVKSKHAGAYQMRLVQQGITAQSNSVYPRTITPNGDGINDIVFFVFENPTDAPSKGTIYDMKSAKVADVKKTDIFAGSNTVLIWDGKDDSGSVVTGGAYIYKIEIGDKTFTGTIVVAR